jgi:hypothetical protein
MTPQEFVTELKERFYHTNKLLQFSLKQQDVILDTIKAFLLKKNLVVVSKVEYDRLVDYKTYQCVRDSYEDWIP